MEPLPTQSFSARALHLLEHVLVVIIGFTLIVFGLAMTFSIVFVIPGVVFLALGLCLLAAGLFARVVSRRKTRA